MHLQPSGTLLRGLEQKCGSWCTPTLDDHIFLVRTSICAFLDSMKSSLSIESSHMILIGIWCSHHF